MYLGLTLTRLGRYADGIALGEAVVEADTNNVEAKYFLARVYALQMYSPQTKTVDSTKLARTMELLTDALDRRFIEDTTLQRGPLQRLFPGRHPERVHRGAGGETMKKGPEHPDAARKKLVGEYLRNADRLLKSGEYDTALAEVEKSLELEPGNFYAQAYKDRITALREKHGRAGDLLGTPALRRPAAGADRPRGDSPTGERRRRRYRDGADRNHRRPHRGGPLRGAAVRRPPGPDGTEGPDRPRAGRRTKPRPTVRRRNSRGRRLEAELRRGEESERLKAAEQQAIAGALAGAKTEAVSEVVTGSKEAFSKLLSAGDTEGAFRELRQDRASSTPPARTWTTMRERLESATLAGAGAPPAN